MPAPGIKKLCRTITDKRLRLTYLQFSHCMLNECIGALTCPVSFGSEVSVQTLSLAHNKLSDNQVNILIQNWTKSRCHIGSVIIVPGNSVSDSGRRALTDFLTEGATAASTAAIISEEPASQSGKQLNSNLNSTW